MAGTSMKIGNHVFAVKAVCFCLLPILIGIAWRLFTYSGDATVFAFIVIILVSPIGLLIAPFYELFVGGLFTKFDVTCGSLVYLNYFIVMYFAAKHWKKNVALDGDM